MRTERNAILRRKDPGLKDQIEKLQEFIIDLQLRVSELEKVKKKSPKSNDCQ